MGIKSALTRLSLTARTKLINKGIGRQYFLGSQNPVVRATAFCARLSSQTPMQAIADAILNDCLNGDKIIEAAANVYRDHFRRFRFNAHESDALAILLLEKPRVQEDLLYGLSVVNLLKHLDLG
ncbi:MAG: hypothetical protein WC529_00540 [Candidatus Margulisiibacteriota bacterium]